MNPVLARMRISYLGLALLLMLSGCARETKIQSAAEMYAEALSKANSADYESAIKLYLNIQANHPFGQYAQQAGLNLTHLFYQQNKFSEAVLSADRFMATYPGHDNLDYIFYLRALSLMGVKSDFISRTIYPEITAHSRSLLLESHHDLQELLNRYPGSIYSDDARLRMRFIVNFLARSQLLSAQHYLRIGAYAAAGRRAAQLVEFYPDSSSTEEALAILVVTLQEMGAADAAADTLVSLQASYPESELIGPAESGTSALIAKLNLSRRGDYFTNLLH